MEWPSIIVFFGLFLWITLNTFFIQPVAWLSSQILLASGFPLPDYAWIVISIIHGLLLLIPTFLLALLWPNRRYRSIFQAWSLAATAIVLYSPVRLVGLPDVLAANALQIIISLILIGLLTGLLLIKNRPGPKLRPNASSFLTFSFSGLIILPWLAWGALGSPLDSFLNLLAGLLFGLFSGLLIAYFLFQPLAETSEEAGQSIVLGGLAAGATLLLLASGFGYGGLQLHLMIVLPPLSWALIMIAEWFDWERPVKLKWLPPALLIGLVAAVPMMMVDPDELNLELALGARDQLSWSLYAALASLVITMLLSLLLAIFHSFFARILTQRIQATGAVFIWSGILAVYLYTGQPGFHGDQLFVILADQADITTASTIEDFDSRRQFVYDTLRMEATSDQAGIRRVLDRFGVKYTPYYLMNALAVDGGPLVQLWLETQPEVDRVLHNPVLRPLPAISETTSGSATGPSEMPWNLSLIKADQVKEQLGITGVGIVIGQSDTGVEANHPELALSYRGRGGNDNYNWLDPWNGSVSPVDIGGHGTHTLGTIVGQTTGVAPGAEWIACSNLARNLANPALYLDCMQFMLAPYPYRGDPFQDGDPTLSAHVLNNSWGCPEQEGCDVNALLPAVKALRSAGIFVVAAAGNDGPACETVHDPIALYDEVFSVGAIDQSGNLASFSSMGPVTADGSGRLKPDIVAPGVDVLSSFPNGTYEYLPGTSMAGPHVAGVVALVWSANPSLMGDIERTEEILRSTAMPYTGPLPPCVSASSQQPNNGAGYGIIDAYAAVQLAQRLP